MMKNILIKIISFYQRVPGPFHGYCKHIPSCSNYMKDAINEYGALKGFWLGFKRILRCNPFGTYGYDPVPKKEEREKKMKKNKFKILVIIFALFMLTGCNNNNNESTMTAITSIYPVEYILDTLYGDNISITSIYPDGISYKDYDLTDNQIDSFSKRDLYVYNGLLDKEKNYAVKMLNKNKKIKIIDSTLGMNYNYSKEQLWLMPSNYLMMASNIKTGLEEYITVSNEIKKINKNYNNLKYNLSKLDAELKESSNTSNNNLIVSSDSLKFLENYGFNVYSLEENDNLNDKTISDVKKLFGNKKNTYIIMKDNEEENQTIKNIKSEYKDVQTIKFHSLATLTKEEKLTQKDYLSIMNENLNVIKTEVNS